MQEVTKRPLVSILTEQLGSKIVMENENYVFLENNIKVAQEEVDIALDTQQKEMLESSIALWKENRQLQVDNLEVIYNGITYQSSEKDRARMASAIAGMNDTETQKWRAKDNSEVFLTKAELQIILKDGNDQQTAIWFPEVEV